MAAWFLYKEGFIEPPEVTNKPYDILLHQILSVVKERGGISYTNLQNTIHSNFAFSQISEAEIAEILNHLIETEMLEKLGREIIIGIEGEKIVNNRDFYSVFKTEENFKVINEGNTIGELPFSPQIKEDENILLAARVWKIIHVDEKAHKILVIKTQDGKPPLFFGGGGIVHPKIRVKMLEILYSDTQYTILDKRGLDEINELRKDFSIFNIEDLLYDRPVLEKVMYSKEDNKDHSISEFCSFTGTKINRTIGLFLHSSGIEFGIVEHDSSFTIFASKEELEILFTNLNSDVNNINP